MKSLQHRPESREPFYCGVYEAHPDGIRACDGKKPERLLRSCYEPRKSRRASTRVDFPVESVSWLDAVDLCNKLSEREKRQPCYHIINLVRREDGSVKEARARRLKKETATGCRPRRNGNTPAAGNDDPLSFGQLAQWDTGELRRHKALWNR